METVTMEIVELATGEVVRSFSCPNHDRDIDRVIRGALINMNTNEYIIRVAKSEDNG